jgi:hypothetical protein
LAAAVYAGAAAGAMGGIMNAAFSGGDFWDYVGGAVAGGVIGGITAAATFGLGGLLKNIPIGGKIGQHGLLTLGYFLDNGFGSGAAGSLGGTLGSSISNTLVQTTAPTINTNNLRSTPETMPDMTRDCLEYHGTMTNAYRSSGHLDWVHYDSYGIRSVTSYSAMSGASNAGHTINAGTWTAYQLESSPFLPNSSDNYAFYGPGGTTNDWGFKVRLQEQFGRDHILIHPGMYYGTGGCIGLDNATQLLDFYIKMLEYNLTPNHTLKVYVSYGN